MAATTAAIITMNRFDPSLNPLNHVAISRKAFPTLSIIGINISVIVLPNSANPDLADASATLYFLFYGICRRFRMQMLMHQRTPLSPQISLYCPPR